MTTFARKSLLAAAATLAVAALPSYAADQVIELNVLTANVTALFPLAVGDSLTLDTSVTTAPSSASFTQVVNFTVGTGVTGIFGQAAWQVTTAAGPGPRVTGFDFNIFNATTNALVVSDSNVVAANGWATSSFAVTALTPGNYRMEVSGSTAAGRGVIFDATVTAVPEPATYAMLLGGLGAIGFMARRRRG